MNKETRLKNITDEKANKTFDSDFLLPPIGAFASQDKSKFFIQPIGGNN